MFENLNWWEIGALLMLALLIFGERLPKVIGDGLRMLRGLRAIHLDGGTSDEWYLELGAEAFRDALAEVGVTDVRFETFDGGHMGIDHRYPASLAYPAPIGPGPTTTSFAVDAPHQHPPPPPPQQQQQQQSVPDWGDVFTEAFLSPDPAALASLTRRIGR